MLPWLLATAVTALLLGLLGLRQSSPRRLLRSYAPPWLRPLPPDPGAVPPWLQRLVLRLQRPALEAAFPDLLAHLATRTAAGATLLGALTDAPQVLPEPLRSQVERLVAECAIAPVPVALERFAGATCLPAAHNLARVLRHQQVQGTPVAEALAAADTHMAGLLRQQGRKVARNMGALMAVLTVVLLINALLLLLWPTVQHFFTFWRTGQL